MDLCRSEYRDGKPNKKESSLLGTPKIHVKMLDYFAEYHTVSKKLAKHNASRLNSMSAQRDAKNMFTLRTRLFRNHGAHSKGNHSFILARGGRRVKRGNGGGREKITGVRTSGMGELWKSRMKNVEKKWWRREAGKEEVRAKNEG